MKIYEFHLTIQGKHEVTSALSGTVRVDKLEDVWDYIYRHLKRGDQILTAKITKVNE